LDVLGPFFALVFCLRSRLPERQYPGSEGRAMLNAFAA
jgi:hypothetical protein